MVPIRVNYLLSLALFLLAIIAMVGWRLVWSAGAMSTARDESGSRLAPTEDGDIRLSDDDPKTVVLALWSECVYNPRNERQWSCDIRADGSMTVVDFWMDECREPSARNFSLTAAELQGLLRFVIREKNFFDMAKDHVHIEPGTASRRGPYHINVLRVQADGRQHEVKYLLEAPPDTREIENLKAILARIETVKAAAIAKSNPARKEPGQ